MTLLAAPDHRLLRMGHPSGPLLCSPARAGRDRLPAHLYRLLRSASAPVRSNRIRKASPRLDIMGVRPGLAELDAFPVASPGSPA